MSGAFFRKGSQQEKKNKNKVGVSTPTPNFFQRFSTLMLGLYIFN
jgi:hypothetical protein